ncbi:uncharacterized protein TrAFT101_004121 [Trichoderma asperellum]|uniref:Uncharacterized protein n=1 Tax=Trichoderma asperellum (strain ATCC 204424 / CBS 433.97 / NBRC 101777) TaxID=1042311 RepID=A0A2T3ZNR2_TRIA4|nr:hypothetical protein M441DRAFT_216031 [Trichoderma asperellum CBS 433.97]PTB46428.1 hypothetical protein M441DRAFT_216031 [Trichoderma asperellum CBS 433.97]UKZ88360.1 hypothetical protein TrAFT101_004121 [Trichoderma asperellum]
MTWQTWIQQFLTENPIQTAFLFCGISMIATPAAVAGFILGVLGFSAGGVAAGSLAATMHAIINPITAGSLFAILQSAGAAGAGLVTVATAIQAAGAALIARPVYTILQYITGSA